MPSSDKTNKSVLKLKEVLEDWEPAMKTEKEFLNSLTGVNKREPIGVTITCRMVVKSDGDWRYVDDLLDSCREHGSAEITGKESLAKDSKDA